LSRSGFVAEGFGGRGVFGGFVRWLFGTFGTSVATLSLIQHSTRRNESVGKEGEVRYLSDHESGTYEFGIYFARICIH